MVTTYGEFGELLASEAKLFRNSKLIAIVSEIKGRPVDSELIESILKPYYEIAFEKLGCDKVLLPEHRIRNLALALASGDVKIYTRRTKLNQKVADDILVRFVNFCAEPLKVIDVKDFEY